MSETKHGMVVMVGDTVIGRITEWKPAPSGWFVGVDLERLPVIDCASGNYTVGPFTMTTKPPPVNADVTYTRRRVPEDFDDDGDK